MFESYKSANFTIFVQPIFMKSCGINYKGIIMKRDLLNIDILW